MSSLGIMAKNSCFFVCKCTECLELIHCAVDHDGFCMSNSAFLGISLEITLCCRLTMLLNDKIKLQRWGFLHQLPQAEIRLVFIPPRLLPSVQCDI